MERGKQGSESLITYFHTNLFSLGLERLSQKDTTGCLKSCVRKKKKKKKPSRLPVQQQTPRQQYVSLALAASVFTLATSTAAALRRTIPPVRTQPLPVRLCSSSPQRSWSSRALTDTGSGFPIGSGDGGNGLKSCRAHLTVERC